MNEGTRSTLQRIYVPATSSACLTWPVAAAATAVSILLHLLTGNEVLPGSIGFRLFAAAVSAAPMLAVVQIAYRSRPSGLRASVAWMLLSYAIAGAIRGLTLSSLLDAAQLQIGGGWEYRVPAGVISMGVTLAMLTFGWSTFTAQQHSASELHAESVQLQQAVAQLEIESRAEVLRHIGDVSNSLLTDLDAIAVRPVDTQVLEIQRLIDERVRPLSRDFAADIKRWTPKAIPPASPGLAEVWSKIDPLDHLPSPWIALVLALSPLPWSAYVGGSSAALLLGGGVLFTIWLGMRILYPLMRRGLRRLRDPFRAAAITLSLEALAIAPTAAAASALRNTANPTALTVASLVSFPLLGWFVIIGGMLWQAARQQEQRLIRVREELQHAIARIGLLSWFHRGVISRLLHGPIQNSLHATVIRLRDQPANTVIDEVIAELRRRIADVEPMSQGTQVQHLDRTLDEVRALWAGIADVTFELEPGVLAALAADAPASAILSDMCHEVCSNAIRHGAATHIEIHVAHADDLVTLTVHGNGSAPESRASAGVGTQFLDTCSVSWSLERQADGNRLQVVIPCSAKVAA